MQTIEVKNSSKSILFPMPDGGTAKADYFDLMAIGLNSSPQGWSTEEMEKILDLKDKIKGDVITLTVEEFKLIYNTKPKRWKIQDRGIVEYDKYMEELNSSIVEEDKETKKDH